MDNVTIGVGEYRTHASVEQTIREADVALRRGKTAGKSQVAPV